MLEKDKINLIISEFNLKYNDKKIWHCPLLGNSINFDYENLTFCCSSTMMGKNPIICEYNKDILVEFGKDQYIVYLINVIERNQTSQGPCVDCKHLSEINFVPLQYDNIQITHLVYNHFRGCNANCVYCSSDTNVINLKYESLPIVKKCVEEGFIIDKATIDYGGGEPTLLPNLDEYIKFGAQHNYKQLINTSGLIFNEAIFRSLQDEKLIVQISVDSGTKETYEKVKGQNEFLKVWNNINRYCEYNKNVRIKYIVFSYNSSFEEIDYFIQLCVNNNVKNVVISGESLVAWQREKKPITWKFGKQEIKACAYLMEQCLIHKISYFLSTGNFSVGNEIAINNQFDKYLKKRIDPKSTSKSICIFGMGENGIKLYKTLKENGLCIDCFCDNNTDKQGTKYDNIRCISPEKLEKNKNVILVAVSQYESILKQLEDRGMNEVYVLNL